MWLPSFNPKASGIRRGVGGNGLVAVCIDKDKGSHHALKWAVDGILSRGQTVVLIHVVTSSSPASIGGGHAIVGNTNNPAALPQRIHQLDKNIKDLFLTSHCYCTRKDIHCFDVLLEDTDVVKAITEYVSYAAIENLVLGATSKHGFIRFKSSCTPSHISKGAPDFCTVYVISKGKISSVRNASRAAPHSSPLLSHIQNLNKQNDSLSDIPSKRMNLTERTPIKPHSWQDESIKSPFARAGGLSGRSCMDFAESDADISFVSSRPSSDHTSCVLYDYPDSGRNSRLSTSSDRSFGSMRLGFKFNDPLSPDMSYSQGSSGTSMSYSSQIFDDAVEADMRKLKLELKQTMDMYSAACREALTAQQKLMELNHWRLEEEKKLEEARLAQEAALAIAEKEKARSKLAMETAEAQKKIAEVETHKRASVEMKAIKEAEEMRKLLDNVAQSDARFRRYSIEEIEKATEFFSESRKIGEGGYGPVYKCYLDHTPVAVKVLRPDAAQGKSQFQQEIDILSCIRHPNMVLLVGACPEYGILIYEYLANGSLEDCLFQKGNGNGRIKSWQLRFRIAAEIATGLLFLHQTKPEPLVHRDLKPGNILLDQNYISKISDVGLARLVPAVAENVTQYRLTSTAGTFCYIDPEYQQTGMLGVKSDVYSLGIILLQLITGKPPMGLAHHVGQAIEKGTFQEMLDPFVTDWPVEQTLTLAQLGVQCAELRRKDRPDLGKQVLPELFKLRDFAEENMSHIFLCASTGTSPYHSQTSVQQEEIVDSGSPRSPSTPIGENEEPTE